MLNRAAIDLNEKIKPFKSSHTDHEKNSHRYIIPVFSPCQLYFVCCSVHFPEGLRLFRKSLQLCGFFNDSGGSGLL
jgi:hypothetical protein